MPYKAWLRVIRENENVLVEFFAPWCPACVTFLPHLETLKNSNTDLPLTVVKVFDDGDPVKNFDKKSNVLDRHRVWTSGKHRRRPRAKGTVLCWHFPQGDALEQKVDSIFFPRKFLNMENVSSANSGGARRISSMAIALITSHKAWTQQTSNYGSRNSCLYNLCRCFIYISCLNAIRTIRNKYSNITNNNWNIGIF